MDEITKADIELLTRDGRNFNFACVSTFYTGAREIETLAIHLAPVVETFKLDDLDEPRVYMQTVSAGWMPYNPN